MPIARQTTETQIYKHYLNKQQMDFKNFLQRIIEDVKVDATQHFDKNFERKAFFNQKWPTAKYANNRGSLMMRTGALRRSIRSSIQGNSIVFTSSVPYATIHNDGGEIEVTQKMKRFFWAMYYKSGGAAKKAKGERGAKLNAEAEKWKALALQPIGTKMKIEKRQFIGDHPVIRGVVIRAVNENLKELNNEILKTFKK